MEKNKEYERTNEFRELQEESRRLSTSINQQNGVSSFIKLYEEELKNFYNEKLKTSIAGTLLLQGY